MTRDLMFPIVCPTTNNLADIASRVRLFGTISESRLPRKCRNCEGRGHFYGYEPSMWSFPTPCHHCNGKGKF